MRTETYQMSKDAASDLNIEELVRHSKGLTLRLKISETEVAQLHLAVDQLEGENLALIVKLEDANNEIGRLDMVLRHNVDSLKAIKRQPPRKP